MRKDMKEWIIMLIETAFLMGIAELILPKNALSKSAERVIMLIKTLIVIEPIILFLTRWAGE